MCIHLHLKKSTSLHNYYLRRKYPVSRTPIQIFGQSVALSVSLEKTWRLIQRGDLSSLTALRCIKRIYPGIVCKPPTKSTNLEKVSITDFFKCRWLSINNSPPAPSPSKWKICDPSCPWQTPPARFVEFYTCFNWYLLLYLYVFQFLGSWESLLENTIHV